MKNFNVHVKNGISLSRVREKTQVGLEDKYKMKFEGVDQRDDKRYEKNFSRMMGLCDKCKDYDKSKKDTVTGEHCRREFCNK